MMDLHYLFEKVGTSARASEANAVLRQKLSDLSFQIRILKNRAGLPELVPVFQMASALDGLIKQLIDRTDALNRSTLRTIEGAITVLADLCAPELRVDIATNPPIRILVVDDDAVSRFALSASIKKVFNPPDFAENGETGLSLASRHPYDLIFMDVKMPGMDGFEVCSRIKETEQNQSTPVVFVTGLKDFDSQTTSIVSGGSDLIGKPFLTFEIAVKALTLVLHARLKTRDSLVEEANAEVSSGTLPPNPEDAGAGSTLALADPAVSVVENLDATHVRIARSSHPFLPNEALGSITATFEEMRKELEIIGQTLDDAGRREKLKSLCLLIQSLMRRINLTQLRPALQLCSALQGLLQKLQEKPANMGASTLGTAADALALLKDLCLKGVRPDLATTPAISILVVDDEPLTRRAIVGALQTAFLKPDSAENGEAALALVAAKTFDVIFLDVQMPGMDGFQACAKIREAGLNRATPVIFVTSHTDFKSRMQSARCGANDFVVKPFLFAEMTVKALTYSLRNRLQKLAPEAARQSPGGKHESFERESDSTNFFFKK